MSIARIKVTSSRLFKTADNIEKRTKESKKIAGGIGKTLVAQSVFKKQSIVNRNNIYQKRKDAIRRRDQKDSFQASKSTSSIRRIGKVVTNSNKGFLGRVLDAIALTMVGWALTNLPTIISLSKQLGDRMSKMTGVLSSFMTNTFSILQEIGTLSGAFIRNLVSFDFDDMGKQVDNSLSKVLNSFNRMELDFANALRLLVEPFDFEIEAEEQQPPAAPTPTPPGTPAPPTSPGGPGAASRWKPILDLVESAEGGYESVNYGKGPGRIPGLTKMTIRQAFNATEAYRARYGGSGAMGKYQIVDNPLGRAKSAGLNVDKDLFSVENQDKIGVYMIEKERKITPDLIKNNPVEAAKKLSQLFAGIPVLAPTYSDYAGRTVTRGESFYQGYGGNRATVSAAAVESAFKKFGSAPVPPAQTTPSPTTPAPVQPGALGSRPLQKGDVLTQSIGRGVSLIDISDVYGSRGGKHGGIDITAPTGTWIALRVDCEWVGYKPDFPAGPGTGYGHVLDVWAPELGVQLRFAHLMSKPNAFTKIKAGTSFAQVGSTGESTGPHIHFEYTKQKGKMGYGSDADPSPYVPYILLTNKPNNAAFSVPGKGTATPAIVSGTNAAVAKSNNITPEKGERTLVVAAPASMYQNPATMTGSSGGSPILVVGPSLNNLIKQRILIELAYT